MLSKTSHRNHNISYESNSALNTYNDRYSVILDDNLDNEL